MTYIILFSAVIIGVFFGEIIKPYKKIKTLFLSFSGAFLLAITVFHLLPEVYESDNSKIGAFIMLGVFIQIFLEFISKGIEHAHDPISQSNHDHSHTHSHNHSSRDSKLLFTMPMFLSLSIHAFLEGAPISGHDHEHLAHELSNPVLLGVFIHKVPIASILYVAFRDSGYSKSLSTVLLIVFGLMTPAGSYLANNIEYITHYTHEINAVVIGIFLHISTTILFESSSGHKFNSAKLIVITLATALVYLAY